VRIEDHVNIVALALVLGAAACSSGRQPSYEANNWPPPVSRESRVAPIVDARANKFHDVAVLADVRRAVDGALSEKATR
jgi:hypothetical protein